VGESVPITWSSPACRIRDLGYRRMERCSVRRV
jgi:hypothetical protein